MNRNQAAINRALTPLGHPLTLCMIGLLLLNTLIFQKIIPSWWTGKLGDLAWLAVAPLMLNLGLAVIGLSWADSSRLKAAVITAGAFFILVKTVPWANDLTRELFHNFTGTTAKLALDPTDLLALPGLAFVWWVTAHPWRIIGKGWKIASAGLASLALVADAAAPQVLGVTCLVEGVGSIKAYYETIPSGYGSPRDISEWKYYPSSDGGLTWNAPTDLEKDEKVPCGEYISWPLQDPSDAAAQIYYVSGQGMYSSQDGGQTLVQVWKTGDLPVYDYLFDSASGNLLFANGINGVIVRDLNGAWTQVQVGPVIDP